MLQQAAALKKKQTAPESKELPLQDKRAKLKAQVRKLTSTLDKQQELLAAQQIKVQQLRRELATTHIELAKLPEEVLPAPKKIPMELLEPSLVDLMKYVQTQAKGGDTTASTHGRCRKATAKLCQQSVERFKKKYPEVTSPKHEDYEFFSFLRDRQLVYPDVWEVPAWFRRATLLASAEQEKPKLPLVEEGVTYPVRQSAQSRDESDDEQQVHTSPASVPGGTGGDDAAMQEVAPKEDDTESMRTDARRSPPSSPLYEAT
eukprot:4568604-Amphidinium_carterae.1